MDALLSPFDEVAAFLRTSRRYRFDKGRLPPISVAPRANA
jgi:hypothetical protein